MSFIHYKSGQVLRHHTLPGIGRFNWYFRAYGRGVMPLDRSGVISFPVRTTSMFPLPEIGGFSKTYEEVCDERAVELLARDVPLYCFWSGGIDSTCALVSLLKQATRHEQIVVLLSEASISEYPDFYRKNIRGKFQCQPAATFPYLLGTKTLLVSGEHNDQLFGSDVISKAIDQFGFDAVTGPYDRELFIGFFTERMEGNRDQAIWYVDLFERLKDGAPIPLRTNYDLFWWINFTVKWQNVFMRMLSFVSRRNRGGMNGDYVRNFYAPFFCTDDFQRWSMSNLDKKVRGSWSGYKWPAKDVIYDFTGDAVYRDNKIKIGSLQFMIVQQDPAPFIDDKFTFRDVVEPAEFYEPSNDFR